MPDDVVGDKVFTSGIGFDDSVNEILRHVAVVNEELFGVFWQAVTAVAEARIIVVRADTGVEADALDDLLAIQAMSGGISIELVKVRNAHGQIGIGKEFDSFGLSRIGKEDGDVLLDCAFFEQTSEDLGAPGIFADDNARGMQVVIQCPALTQELRREDEVLGAERFAGLNGVANGDGRFDDHRGVGIDDHDVANHVFNGFGIEVVGFGVVVGGGGDDDVVGPLVSVFLIQSGTEVERLVLEVILKLAVLYWRFLAIEHRDLPGDDVQSDDFVVLRQQHTVRQTYVTGSGYSDFHR